MKRDNLTTAIYIAVVWAVAMLVCSVWIAVRYWH